MMSIASSSPCRFPSSMNGAPMYGMMMSPTNIPPRAGREDHARFPSPPPFDRNDLVACPADPDLLSLVDRHVGMEALHLLHAKPAAEERCIELSGSGKDPRHLFGVVVAGI